MTTYAGHHNAEHPLEGAERDIQDLLDTFPMKWGWLLALGITMIMLGAVGLWLVVYLTIASVLVFGGFMLAAGLLQLWHGIKARETAWKGRFQHYAVAVAYIILAGAILWDPLAASAAITLFIGALFAALGIVRIVDAVRYQRQHWQWVLPVIVAVLELAIAAIVILQWPMSGLWVIGLFVAIELILNGWLLVFTAWVVRKLRNEPQLTREQAG